MPQAALPDLNQAIITYRHSFVQALSWRDPVAILRAAVTLNGCLDNRHKISWVPWAEYKELIKAHQSVNCPHCGKMHPAHPSFTVSSKWPPAMRKVLGEKQEYRYIQCAAETTKKIWLDDPKLDWVIEPTNIYELELPAPLPPPHNTLAERTEWSQDIDEWSRTLATIIEDRCRRFRASYAAAGAPDAVGDEGEAA